MSNLSLAIRNAMIVDGTGAPAYPGDIGVLGERIVAVGNVEGEAEVEIDAGGKVLAPGFIDIHTHYDPQLCWDRLASPSPEHGVTSLIIGNCSVSLAPVRPEQTDLVVRLFGAVEDMESGLLKSAVPFQWETFGDYLRYLQEGLGPNVGVLMGHSNLRFYVMGKEAQERVATDEEIAEMAEILRQALRVGALGLSFTLVHFDDKAQPLPSAYSDRREMLAFMNVMAEEGRGFIESTPPALQGMDAIMAFLDEMGSLALETQVMCSISPISQSVYDPMRWRRMLMKIDAWRARGAPIFAQTQVRPDDNTLNVSMGSTLLSKAPTFRRLMDLPLSERLAQLRDPAVVRTIDEEGDRIPALLPEYVVKRVVAAENEKFLGRALKDIAAENGKSVVVTMVEIALADELKTDFALNGVNHSDASIVGVLISHPHVHIGSGDAGAHINQFAGAGDTTYLFEKFVREEGYLTIERAVQLITSDLARAFGLRDRGELREGNFADMVLFDPEQIKRGDEVWVEDLPIEGGRYIRHPKGIDKVFVNARLLVDQGRYTSERPGQII